MIEFQKSSIAVDTLSDLIKVRKIVKIKIDIKSSFILIVMVF